MQINLSRFVLILSLFLTFQVQGQSNFTGQSLYPWDADVVMKNHLEENGEVEVGVHAVAWFPLNQVDSIAKKNLVAELDKGIASAKEFIGKPDWHYQGDSRIYFYFPDEKFVAHAPGGNTAFIPLWRITDNQAPWLHESVHLLLQEEGEHWLAQPVEYGNERMPLWLHEGIADYVAMTVSDQEGITFYSPLNDASINEQNKKCQQSLPDEIRDQVLAKIGDKGRMPELFGPDRFT